MTENSHNGWTNYQTWVVNLWIDNDEGMHETMREWAQECMQDAIDKGCDADSARNDATYELGQRIEQWHDEYAPETQGVFADLLTRALGQVNWYEIAENYIDDLELFCAGWNMPGYLPDSEPSLFTDADKALDYIKNEISELDPAIYPDAETWADSCNADENGEFGQKIANYHYFVMRV
jgi:hypothetical protein